MKSLVGLVVLFAVSINATEKNLKSIPMNNGERHKFNNNLNHQQFQPLVDHFSPTNNSRAFFQYYMNLEFFDASTAQNKPIYIFINDGGALTTHFLLTGLMHDIAQSTNGVLVGADLRYYRENLPTIDASLENLEFLTVEQQLADIAILIETVREVLHTPHSPVILWGSGYGATLAVWAKQKYPHLVNGVWSSSGIFERTVHTAEPFESLTRTIRSIGGDVCADRVEDAFELLEYHLRHLDIDVVADKLDLCFRVYPFDDSEMALFNSGILTLLREYLNVYHFHGIRNFCADLAFTGEEGDEEFSAFDALARWVRFVFTDKMCLDLSLDSRIPEASRVEWEFINAIAWRQLDVVFPFDNRPLLYHRCTQLGHFETTVNGNTIFGRLIAQDYFFDICQSIFRAPYSFVQLQTAINELNLHYGAKNPGIDGVIFTNGLLDPLLSAGIQEYNLPNSQVFNIPQYAKSADLFSEAAHDSDALILAKRAIRNTIIGWVTPSV